MKLLRRQTYPSGICALVSTRTEGLGWQRDRQVCLWDAKGRETVGVAARDTYPQSHDVVAFGRPQAIGASSGEVQAPFGARRLASPAFAGPACVQSRDGGDRRAFEEETYMTISSALLTNESE